MYSRLFPLIFPLLSSFIFSQTGSISGTVRGLGPDSPTDGEPLISANVYLKGTMIGSITDTSGVYSISRIPIGKYTLVADYFGFKTQKIDIYISVSDADDGGTASGLQKLGISTEEESGVNVIKGNKLTGVNFVLEEDVFKGDEVVVTGVASERSVEISEVAVTRLDPRHLNESTSYSDFGTLLGGKVSGLDIRKPSGTVGGGFRFDVRAGGGLNGNEQPVIFIDGMRVDNNEVGPYSYGQGISTLLDFNPDDIENIEILKGPASATSYGTNGSNGIVLIETKTGRAGMDKPVFTYKHTTGNNSPEFEIDDGFQNHELFHKVLSPGKISDNYFSVSGGDYKARYFISFSNRYEEGMLIWKHQNYFDRTSIRGNFDLLPQDNLKLSLSTSYSAYTAKIPHSDNSIYGTISGTLISFFPWGNADSAAFAAIDQGMDSKRFTGSISATYYPFQKINQYGLNTMVLKGKVGIDDVHRDHFTSFSSDYNYGSQSEGEKGLKRTDTKRMNYEIGLAHSFNNGPLVAKTSFTAQFFDNLNQSMDIWRENFGQSEVTNISSAPSIREASESFFNSRDAGGVITEELSLYDQYYLTLSYRKDYASSLGSKSESIGYPGIRFATRLDKLSFVPEQFNLLKFRMAYGESGMLPGHDDGIALLWSGGAGGVGGGANIYKYGNEDIEPERISEVEFGLDLTWENLLSLELTKYNQWAENSIVYAPLAPSLGYGEVAKPTNIGSMEMEGFETLLKTTPINKKDLKVDISASYSWNDSEITEMGDPICDDYGVMCTQEGYPKYHFWGSDVSGAKVDTLDLSMMGLGVIPYFDPIGGVLTNEKHMLGRAIPQHTGNLSVNVNYKVFDFYMLFERKTGFMAGEGTRWRATSPDNSGHTAWLASIQKLGLDGLFAQMGILPEEFMIYFNPVIEPDEVVGTVNTDLYIATGGAVPPLPVAIPGKEAEWENALNEFAFNHPSYITNFGTSGDFTRLREINFGVNLTQYLPVLKLDNAISGLRVYFSAQNVKLWRASGTVGVDPELNISGAVTEGIGLEGRAYRSVESATMPHPTVYNFGINVRF